MRQRPERIRGHESELERVRRQMKEAREYVALGYMTQRDFQFYDDTYWQPTIARETRRDQAA